jgi:signal transduction histidine kinase/ActR/RegA family two-component response regulator
MNPGEGSSAQPRRVLIVAPEGRDAKVISQVLAGQGLQARICNDLVELIAGLDQADAAFITEESLQQDPHQLTTWIAQQPPWSDFPFVVLVARRQGRRPRGSLDGLVGLGNLVLLERPLNAETLTSAAHSALRGRSRQYEAQRQLRAEAELRRAEQQARTAAAEAGQALGVAVDAGELGTFHCPLPMSSVDCSARCREHLGLPAEGAIDLKALLGRVHRDDVGTVRDAFFDGPPDTDSREVEFRTLTAAGSVRWVRAKGRIYRQPDGTPTRFDGVTLDVTSQKLMERERESLLEAERVARREAERAGRMKDEFISTLSHELRTPLSAILGWTYILRRGGAATDVTRAADTIERNARAQAQLIEDLLDVSRIASGNIRLELQPVSVTAVFDAVQQMLRPIFEAKPVAVSIDADSWGGEITADPGRLQQIVWNIVSNAIKFTPAGGSVRVRADVEAEQLVLSVTDTGAGIHPDFLPHVFDRFRQAESSEARSYGGLGLGLAIVRQLVEMHGGSVEAHSPGQGCGATFIVRLPVGMASTNAVVSPSAGAADARAGHGVLEGLRVLVVDDEQDGRDMLAILLRSHGASVQTADSADRALDLLEQDEADLLISDIGMPNTDGYQLVRSIRASARPWQNIPAIALTAFARAEDALKARLAGFDAHLAKPVEPVRLVASIVALVSALESRD